MLNFHYFVLLGYCPSGEEKVGSDCNGCSRGYYKDNNVDVFSSCTQCDEDFITPSTKAKSVSECTERKLITINIDYNK